MAELECISFPNNLLQKQPDEVLSLLSPRLKSPQRPQTVRPIEVVANSSDVAEGRKIPYEFAALVRRYHHQWVKPLKY
ncbi:hypothetical protein [Neobacillus mesonae]|uniref:hypothetical protein n=1 Tax=Neobacillus mesonae TaxID=1193713 RepID=UPI00129010FA|nr:hypothetical protein [Neobacillus mesonae]